ncbi:GntR family transcriptional regulator [Pseudomonas putida]|uniref:GntR family transcriptional regulator n=1 Tax=Pseudomonas TaxID=286 RepID=UPI0006D3CCB3|nr:MULTISPECIES: GntR family transcriptional regulator [Pseudomonas]MBI6944954.1 GntR family transcriptional regulator [Pseudomonas putida]MBI6961258.1 GntR family transcriptional regulator [Pseudomonas putida]PZQ38837.1 MAG: FCD domain-containing protein [Pseudomonas putida]
MVQLTSLQTKVAGQILSAIQSGELAPGNHLKEVELAERFGVSRSPVRGALAYLADQRLIEPMANHGFRVPLEPAVVGMNAGELQNEEDALYARLIDDRLSQSLPDQISESDLLRRYNVGKSVLRRCLLRLSDEGVMQRKHGHGWQFAPTLSDRQTRFESYRFRMLLEPAGLLEPTFRLNQEQLQRCRKQQLDLLDGIADSKNFFESNAQFHELLAAASGNAYILQAVQQQNRLRRLTEFHSVNNVERVKVSCREHLAILDALEQGDNEWASTLLHRHLEVASKMGVARSKA